MYESFLRQRRNAASCLKRILPEELVKIIDSFLYSYFLDVRNKITKVCDKVQQVNFRITADRGGVFTPNVGVKFYVAHNFYLSKYMLPDGGFGYSHTFHDGYGDFAYGTVEVPITKHEKPVFCIWR